MISMMIIFGMVAAASVKATLQGRVSRRLLHNGQDSALFHAGLFFLTAVIMAVLFPPNGFSPYGVLLACGAGLLSVVYQITYAAALKAGSVSLTALLSNFNTLFVTLFCITVYRETVYLTQLFGILLLILSMLLIVKNETRKEPKKPLDARWLFLSVSAMLSCAGANILMKMFSKYSGGEAGEGRTFVVVMYLFAAAFSLIWYLLNAKKQKKCRISLRSCRVWLWALGIGLALGVYQVFYQMGLASINGGILFPAFAGLQTLSMTLIGVVAFGDRLTARQKWGIACGFLCVVLMNWNFLPLC